MTSRRRKAAGIAGFVIALFFQLHGQEINQFDADATMETRALPGKYLPV